MGETDTCRWALARFRAPLVAAALGAVALAPGCATVSLNGGQAEAAEATELQRSADRLVAAYSEAGWGQRAEEPGMARRLTQMLLSGLARDEEDEAPATPAEAYLADLPETPAAAAAATAEDLIRAGELAGQTRAAAEAALAEPPEAVRAGVNLAAAERAAQSALRGANFFAAVIDALDADLQPTERDQLTRLHGALRAEADRLAEQADAFAERRRDAQGAVS